MRVRQIVDALAVAVLLMAVLPAAAHHFKDDALFDFAGGFSRQIAALAPPVKSLSQAAGQPSIGFYADPADDPMRLYFRAQFAALPVLLEQSVSAPFVLVALAPAKAAQYARQNGFSVIRCAGENWCLLGHGAP